MLKSVFILGASSWCVLVGAAGCGSGAGEQQASNGAGTGGTAAPAGAGGGASDGGAAASGGSLGNASGGSSGANAGVAQGGSGDVASTNLYVDELRRDGEGRCLPRELPFGATGGPNEGRVTCTIAELHASACDCARTGRAELSATMLSVFKQRAEASQWCGGASAVDCAAVCGCNLVQLPGTSADAGSDLYRCQNEVTPPLELTGFCVIDPAHSDENGAAPIGSAELVATCSAESRRRIRFLGPGPSADVATFIGCSGRELTGVE